VDLLQIYVDAWHDTAVRVIALCRELQAEDWDKPTDCPGWTVREVVAHLAAIESELAGGPGPEGVSNERTVSPAYTQPGVEARSGRTPEQLVDEFEAAVATRLAALRDGALDRPVSAPGRLAWDWDTLLRNRVIDLWVHEQDIRRAVRRPGGLDSPGARVTTTAFAMGMPYVLGKRVAPLPGTIVVWEVRDPVAITLAARVGDDGRAVPVDPPPADADAWLHMDTETFALLCAGRRDAAAVDVSVRGDEALAQRVLAAMPLTP